MLSKLITLSISQSPSLQSGLIISILMRLLEESNGVMSVKHNRVSQISHMAESQLLLAIYI